MRAVSKPKGKYKVKALSECHRIVFMKNRELDKRCSIRQDFVRVAPYIYYAYTSLFKITLAETIES